MRHHQTFVFLLPINFLIKCQSALGDPLVFIANSMACPPFSYYFTPILIQYPQLGTLDPCYRGTNVTSFLANLNARTRKGKCFGASQLPSMPSDIRLNNANSRLLRIKFHYKLSKPYSVVAYLTPATIQGRQQIDSFRTPARQHCVKQALQNVCFVINFI